jgi:hypothetical protein
MAIECEVWPKQDATPEQLKALGSALQRWFAAFLQELAAAGRDVEGWMDPDAVRDLLTGELPQPIALRFVAEQQHPGQSARELRDALDRAREMFPRVRRSLPPADARTVPFGFSLDGTQDLGQLVASLRRHIPAELVEDLFVGGQGWGRSE